MVSGGRPSTDSMRAPRRVSGSMMRRIGRRESDGSPPTTVRNGCAATTPDNRRIVVPEFIASSGAGDGWSPRSPRPSISNASAPVVRTVTPSARRQPSVAAQSAPPEYPSIRDVPSASAESSA